MKTWAKAGVSAGGERATLVVVLSVTVLAALGFGGQAGAQDWRDRLRHPEHDTALDRPDRDAGASQLAQTSMPQSEFDIPAQPLTSALTLFGRQSGLQVTVDGALVRNLSTAGVRGTMTADQALPRLLAGTGLTYSRAGDATIVIRALAEQEQDDAALQLEPITVEGAAESAYGPIRGYKASRSATATKTDTLLLDIPQAIQVVPREVIEDQKANSLSDVARNISNVQASGTFGNRQEALRIRGFEQTAFATDGMPPNPFFGDQIFLDLANVERVEVLKGPASVLFGPSEVGGLVNLVTKQPLDEPYYAADVTVGNFEFVRPTVDLSTPLNEDKSLRVRFNGAYQRNDSFRDFFIDSERVFVAAIGAWDITPDTRLTLNAQYADQENQFDRGLVAVGDDVADVPDSRYLGERFSQFEGEQARARYLLEHNFNSAWQVRNSFRFVAGDSFRFSADPRGVQADNRTLNRRAFHQRDDFRDFRFQNDVIGEFATGFLDHKLLIGAEAARAERKVKFATGTLAPIDIFDPVYGAQPGPLGATNINDDRIHVAGFYLQDQISIGEHWQILVGGRFDYADSRSKRGGSVNEPSEQDFTPRVGLVYKPIQSVSLFAGYGESFEPLVGSTFDGTPFKPETGEQIEAGVKAEFMDNRLSATLAAFELTRQDVLTADPANPGFSVQTGEQRSRGVELDIAGEILPGWQVIASGAYIDAEITEDNRFEPGNRINDVPDFSGSIWSTFEIQQGDFKGLGFGAGLFAVGQRDGDLANTFKVDGYVRTDATVFYSYNEHIEASLNIQNLFDVDYIEASRSRNEIYPGAPLTVLGTLSLRF